MTNRKTFHVLISEMSDAKSLGRKFITDARKTAKMLTDFQQFLKIVKFVGSFNALYWSGNVYFSPGADIRKEFNDTGVREVLLIFA